MIEFLNCNRVSRKPLTDTGVVTNRDDWVYDEKPEHLQTKVKYLISVYNAQVVKHGGKGGTIGRAFEKLPYELDKALQDRIGAGIKWTRAVKTDLSNGVKYYYDDTCIRESIYRPFIKRYLYFSRQLNEMQYQMPNIFPLDKSVNVSISFGCEDRTEFACIAVNLVPNKDLFLPCAAQTMPRYRFSNGNRTDNITDWGVRQFEKRYGKRENISRDRIFEYVYAVLHNPAYREKYALNLKRELPRIPLYDGFSRWANWGAQLLALHVGFESIEPFALKRVESLENAHRNSNRVKLKADKNTGCIMVDDGTTLTGVPTEAWHYKLGNRCALEWILDQYKESQPRDLAVREHFNTYRFAEYKEHVIDLLRRVTTVSVETQKIVTQMRSTSG